MFIIAIWICLKYLGLICVYATVLLCAIDAGDQKWTNYLKIKLSCPYKTCNNYAVALITEGGISYSLFSFTLSLRRCMVRRNTFNVQFLDYYSNIFTLLFKSYIYKVSQNVTYYANNCFKISGLYSRWFTFWTKMLGCF